MPLNVIKNSVLADPKFELIKCLILTALKYLKGSYSHPRLTGSTSPKKFFTFDSNCWSHPTKKCKYVNIGTFGKFWCNNYHQVFGYVFLMLFAILLECEAVDTILDHFDC